MNGWVWKNGGMVLTGEAELLGGKYYRTRVVDWFVSTEQWWYVTDWLVWSTRAKKFIEHGW